MTDADCGRVRYLDYLPEELRLNAARLLLSAFAEKIVPAIGNDKRAVSVLEESFVSERCLVAVYDDKLSGIMAVQSDNGGFFNITLKDMIQIYGIIDGFRRMLRLLLFYHPTAKDELYVEAVAVAPEMRSLGIGRRFFDILKAKALKEGKRKLTLYVINTNFRAENLYESIGFRTVKRLSVWPLNRIIMKFPFDEAHFMVKHI